MKFILIATLLSIQFFREALLVHGEVGTATSYGPPYTPTKCHGYSQDQFPPSNMFAAVSRSLWDGGGACGRRYRLRCLSGAGRPCKGGTIVVVVVDECSRNPCPTNLRLSKQAFAAISRASYAKINVEYAQI